MTKKVNPQLFRLKNYNFFNSPFTNFFDNINQYYIIKRNIFFFIKFFKKCKFFIFHFKLQRNFYQNFKLFFFGYFIYSNRFFFLLKNFFPRKKRKFKKKRIKLFFKMNNFFLKNIYIKIKKKNKINYFWKKKVFYFKNFFLKKKMSRYNTSKCLLDDIKWMNYVNNLLKKLSKKKKKFKNLNVLIIK